MFIFISLLIISPLILCASDAVMKAQEVEKLEKKAKSLACSFILNSSSLQKQNKEKQIKELLKKNKLLKKESDTKAKINQFLTSVCYSKLDSETANEILTSVSEGNIDLPDKEKYEKLFEYKDADIKKISKVMEEINEVNKEIEEEQKNIHEKRKEDPKLDKTMKDLEEKIQRNPNYDGTKEDTKEEKNEEKKEEKKGEKKDKNKKNKKKGKKKKKKKKIHIPSYDEDEPDYGNYEYSDDEENKFSLKKLWENIGIKNFYAIITSICVIFIPFIIIQISDKMDKKKGNNLKKKNENVKKDVKENKTNNQNEAEKKKQN